MYEYKVVELDLRVAEQIDIDYEMNDLAEQGWRLVSTSAVSDLPSRATLMLFFERVLSQSS